MEGERKEIGREFTKQRRESHPIESFRDVRGHGKDFSRRRNLLKKNNSCRYLWRKKAKERKKDNSLFATIPGLE